MSDAPERIWVKLNGIPKFYESPCDDMPLLERYVRADIHEARIKELEAQVTWQPIETAPKTGISVLLWDEDSSECTIGWYRINHKDDSWRSEYDLNIDATYWMPLPNMPKENKT
jgi:hypothetical protein